MVWPVVVVKSKAGLGFIAKLSLAAKGLSRAVQVIAGLLVMFGSSL